MTEYDGNTWTLLVEFIWQICHDLYILKSMIKFDFNKGIIWWEITCSAQNGYTACNNYNHCIFSLQGPQGSAIDMAESIERQRKRIVEEESELKVLPMFLIMYIYINVNVFLICIIGVNKQFKILVNNNQVALKMEILVLNSANLGDFVKL